MKSVIFLAALLFSFTASSDNKTGTSTMTSVPHEYMVLDFESGATNISAASQDKLTRFIQDAKAKGEIDQVEVAVWSDRDFPAEKQNLTRADQNLADKRGSMLEDILEDKLSVSSVEVFNMAKSSSWWSRAFNTEQAELKGLFTPSAKAPVTQDAYVSIKNNGAPMKAVILVKYEQSRTGTSGAGTRK